MSLNLSSILLAAQCVLADNVISGKWMYRIKEGFVSVSPIGELGLTLLKHYEENIDSFFGSICKAMVDGPLKKSPVICAKVATKSDEDGGVCQIPCSKLNGLMQRLQIRLICVYCRDSWYKDEVHQVLKLLVDDCDLVKQYLSFCSKHRLM